MDYWFDSSYHDTIEKATAKGYRAGLAAAVIHGKWEKNFDEYCDLSWHCSVCKFGNPRIYKSISFFNYCPHCGAKMDFKEKKK